MNVDLMYLTLPLWLLEMMVLAFSVYVFLQVPQKYRLKLIMIPLAFLVSLASIFVFDAMLGYAYPSQLPEKFVLMGYNVIMKDNKKHSIEVWTRKKSTRLYVVPYSKPLEEALKEAGKKAQGGNPVEMNKKKKEAGKEKGGQQEDEYQYESNIRLPHEMVQKEPIEGQPELPEIQPQEPKNSLRNYM